VNAEVERRQNHMRMRRKPGENMQVCRERKVTGGNKSWGVEC